MMRYYRIKSVSFIKAGDVRVFDLLVGNLVSRVYLDDYNRLVSFLVFVTGCRGEAPAEKPPSGFMRASNASLETNHCIPFHEIIIKCYICPLTPAF